MNPRCHPGDRINGHAYLRVIRLRVWECRRCGCWRPFNTDERTPG